MHHVALPGNSKKRKSFIDVANDYVHRVLLPPAPVVVPITPPTLETRLTAVEILRDERLAPYASSILRTWNDYIEKLRGIYTDVWHALRAVAPHVTENKASDLISDAFVQKYIAVNKRRCSDKLLKALAIGIPQRLAKEKLTAFLKVARSFDFIDAVKILQNIQDVSDMIVGERKARDTIVFVIPSSALIVGHWRAFFAKYPDTLVWEAPTDRAQLEHHKAMVRELNTITDKHITFILVIEMWNLPNAGALGPDPDHVVSLVMECIPQKRHCFVAPGYVSKAVFGVLLDGKYHYMLKYAMPRLISTYADARGGHLESQRDYLAVSLMNNTPLVFRPVFAPVALPTFLYTSEDKFLLPAFCQQEDNPSKHALEGLFNGITYEDADTLRSAEDSHLVEIIRGYFAGEAMVDDDDDVSYELTPEDKENLLKTADEYDGDRIGDLDDDNIFEEPDSKRPRFRQCIVCEKPALFACACGDEAANYCGRKCQEGHFESEHCDTCTHGKE